MQLELWVVIGAICVTFLGGFVKGAVGFAMPLVMVSGMGAFVEPRLIVAGLALPMVISNVLQVFRSGFGTAREAAREHIVYISIACVMIFISTQFLTLIPTRVMFLVLGLFVVFFSAIQLFGLRLSPGGHSRRLLAVPLAVVAGLVGGLAGTWGPPTVIYLLALNTPKAQQMAVQGVVYGLGAMVFLIGHLNTGVLNATTLPFSAALVIPGLVGMWVGFMVGDRLDQDRFRKVTMVVLIVAGLNLIRRGMIG